MKPVIAAQCMRCGGQFNKRKLAGNQPQFCSKTCKSAHRKDYYKGWVERNRETVLANTAKRIAEWRKSNPDYFKRHYQKNRDRKKAEANAWYHANKERALKAQKLYNAINREKLRPSGRKSAQKRRAIKKQVFVEAVDPIVVFKRDNGICGICRRKVLPSGAWEIDHVIPISKGGEHSYANVQLSHRVCNRSKWAHVQTLF